jgi:hypothetical protein
MIVSGLHLSARVSGAWKEEESVAAGTHQHFFMDAFSSLISGYPRV